MNMFGATNSG